MNRHERRATAAKERKTLGAMVGLSKKLKGPFASLGEMHASVKAMVEREWSDDLEPLMVIAETEKGEIFHIVPVKYAGDKESVSKLLWASLKQLAAVRYAVVMESWMTTFPVDGPFPDVRPSDDPARTEVVIVAAADAGASRIGGWFDIKRDAAGQGCLGNWIDVEIRSFDIRFLELMAGETPTVQ